MTHERLEEYRLGFTRTLYVCEKKLYILLNNYNLSSHTNRKIES